MDVIKMARELGKALQQEEYYKRFEAAQTRADKDEKLQDMIGAFNLKRMEMNNAINNQEQDQEKMEAVDRELRSIYAEVMSNQNMADVSESKQEIDKTLNFINQILVASMNGQDPDTVEEEAPSCSGSCSSCSGCH